MSPLAAVARKDLRLLSRDRMGLFWALGFPLVMALFFGSLFSGGGGAASAMAIAVVDEDDSDGSRELVARLDASDALDVVVGVGMDEARDRVRRGQLVAFVRITKGFGESWAPFGGTTHVELGIDPSRAAERGMLQGLVSAAAFELMGSRLMSPATLRPQVGQALGQLPPADQAEGQDAVVRSFLESLDTFLANVDEETYAKGLGGAGAPDAGPAAAPSMTSPVRMVDVVHDETGQPRTSWDVSFPSAILWGVLGCTSTFALAMVRERLTGTLQRLRAAPIARWEILGGKGLACALACAGLMTVLLVFGRVAMGMRVASVPLLAVAVLATATCFTGLMMLIAVSSKTLAAVSGTSWGANVVMAMLGGGMIPLAYMPSWLRAASHLSPVKWGIQALEGAIWRDYAYTEMLGPCAVLVAVGAAGFGAGAWLLSRQEG